jgi:hypothetical protein
MKTKTRIWGIAMALSMAVSIGWVEYIQSTENIIVSATIVKMTGSVAPATIPIEFPPRKSIPMSISSNINSKFKSYMDYRFITDKSSLQWKMQKNAVTNEYGIRTYDGLYMVAVGTGYTNSCGVKLKITLSSGIVIMAITGDIKSDKHTDSATHTFAKSNKSVLEFIVDTNKISYECRVKGDMSFANMHGEVIKIEKIV